ncbi:hypothetical protein SAMN05192583_3150 [Sphingomonas gellani]|uniref:Uncharacterized protein n=1 Tax=Sphingomonas gellani TaxID=1166340 RepID=A0A1H8HZ78_9SPHN|nr:hypothetical protein [Sphingomonas gellani]SEN61301.1 hypothetical protein SAMN05192583_3150 [Sphingomonas gellani]
MAHRFDVPASKSRRSARADRHPLLRAAIPLAVLAGTTGCGGGGPRPLDDEEKMVRSVLTLLASTKNPVCTDDHTRENALAVYREMTLAPRPSRAELHWYPPTPLRPDDTRNEVTGRTLRRAELDGERIAIREPEPRRDALPGLAQLELDGAAKRLIRPIGGVEDGVAIRRGWTPARVTARWWPLNRARHDCWPLFVLSDPVRDRRIGFITVRAEHWGTLYALKPQGNDWRVVAEWSRWLY